MESNLKHATWKLHVLSLSLLSLELNFVCQRQENNCLHCEEKTTSTTSIHLEITSDIEKEKEKDIKDPDSFNTRDIHVIKFQKDWKRKKSQNLFLFMSYDLLFDSRQLVLCTFLVGAFPLSETECTLDKPSPIPRPILHFTSEVNPNSLLSVCTTSLSSFKSYVCQTSSIFVVLQPPSVFFVCSSHTSSNFRWLSERMICVPKVSQKKKWK